MLPPLLLLQNPQRMHDATTMRGVTMRGGMKKTGTKVRKMLDAFELLLLCVVPLLVVLLAVDLVHQTC